MRINKEIMTTEFGRLVNNETDRQIRHSYR